MKNMLLILVFALTPHALHADYYEDSRKITKITAIILVCDRSISSQTAGNAENECYDSYLDEHINKSPIKFIARRELSQSASIGNNITEIGKLYGASHILLYKQLGPWGDVAIQYRFRLVNTSTSEIEFSTDVFEYTEDYKKKNRDPVFGLNHGGGMNKFFHILNVNSAVNPEKIPPWRR